MIFERFFDLFLAAHVVALERLEALLNRFSVNQVLPGATGVWHALRVRFTHVLGHLHIIRFLLKHLSEIDDLSIFVQIKELLA